MSNAPMPPPPPPMTPEPAGHKEVRATAKAEKARAKAMRPWFKKKRFWALGIVAIIIIAAVAGSAGSKDKDKDTSSGGSTPSAQTALAVGQTGHTGDLDITLNTVNDPFTPTNSFEKPGDGKRFVAVEVTAKNNSDKPLAFSSLIGVEVTDSEGRPWNIAIAGTDKPQLDGTVQPGEPRRGWMVFEVDQASSGLRLRVKGNLTATGVVFAL